MFSVVMLFIRVEAYSIGAQHNLVNLFVLEVIKYGLQGNLFLYYTSNILATITFYLILYQDSHRLDKIFLHDFSMAIS